MAYTKKNSSKNNLVTNEKDNQIENQNKQDNILFQENKELKTKLIEMQSNMELLMKQITLLSSNNDNKTNDIPSNNREIEVVNLSNSNLLISTTGKSDGKCYNFNEQFDSQFIPEFDLKEIVRTMPKTARNGYFYICDEQFIKENGLYSYYVSMLDKLKMKDLFNLEVNEFIANFNSCPKGQQSIIESMVTNKCLLKEKIDANILIALGKITQKNYLDLYSIQEE